MNPAFWNDLCQQPTLPASSGKYAQLVHDSTIQLQQSLDSILSALNLRAMRSTKCANYESAVRDAQLLQRMSPSSPLGYIREAEVYIQQGQPGHVIAVCNHGLCLVDKKDAHYATLQRTREDAEQRQNVRIDFISKLPVDIVMTSLIPMFMPECPLEAWDPHPELNVCKQWLDRIGQCSGGLRFIIDDAYDEGVPQVARFAQYTKALNITYYLQQTWLSDLLLGNNFCTLRELRIYQYRNSQDGHFLSALKSISTTLTDLSITLVTEDAVLSIADIVSTCPNLNSLQVTGFYGVDLSSLPTATMPKMIVLSITRAKDIISKDEVVGVMQHFPSLKKLTLSPCIDLQSAFVVPKYCPALQRLHMNAYNDKREAELTFTDEGQPCTMKGITDLCISSYSEHPFNDHEIASFLKEYSGTLNCIEWNMPLDNDNDNNIMPIEYPCLTKLTIENHGWWIPRNAPMLEELKITSNAIHANHAVLDTIPPRLKKLTLLADGYYVARDMSPVIRYLQRFYHHSHLKELFIDLPAMINMDHVMHVISHLDQLERLTVVHHMWDYSSAVLEELVNGCRQLTYLDIRSGNPPSTHAISTLKRLQHLQQFTFSIDGIEDLGDFWNTFQTFSQLKCIQIRPANRLNKVNKDAITRLVMHRPDVKVIIVGRMRHGFI